MCRKFLLTALALVALSISARGQFYTPGTDPGNLRWYSIESPYYRLIYPEGADSLARSYARLMEQFRIPISRTVDHVPHGGKWGRKMPIVLHTHHVVSNGSVGYAPVRMDLFTTPEPYGADPVSWNIQLAAHEPRHQAQLEKLESAGLFKGLSYVIGQGSAPLAWVIYLASVRGEGDAVAAETGLAKGTRARTADFLNYMRVAFDQGDWRDFTRWNRGSYKYYTPDFYKAGYMLIAGTRYLYNWPSFTEDGMEIQVKKPWLIAPYDFDIFIKERFGRNSQQSFQAVMEAFNDVWQQDYKARAPFLELQPLTAAEGFPLIFSSLCEINGTLYALREGYLRTRELVTIGEDGKVTPVQTFSSQSSRLAYDPVQERLYWSEAVPDLRWTLSGTSPVRYRDMKSGKVKDLAKGKRYFNPRPSDDGRLISVSEYATTGETYLVVLSAQDGSLLRHQEAPRGVQLTESAWQGEDIYCAGISADGYGLYQALPSGRWVEVLAPSHQKVLNLECRDGFLEWVSDRTGVNELYRYSLSEKTLWQVTNTRYGATDFCQGEETLYCISQTRDGKLVFSVPSSSLKPRKVDFTDLHTYVIEDAIEAQERALGPGPDFSEDVPLSAPKRYYKLAHPLQFHTWLPAYVNADAIMNSSFDFTYENLSPGLTGFFQNTLGTFSGQVGLAAHPDPDQNKLWRAAFHAKVTYKGQYPAIEATLDLGDRRARQYNLTEVTSSLGTTKSYAGTLRSDPLLNASIRAYVPLASRKGGILYGFIPQLRYSFSNNIYGLTPIRFTSTQIKAGIPYLLSVSGVEKAQDVFAQTLSVSARGYAMLPTAKSMVYPRCGVGLEGGVLFRPFNLTHFRPVVFGYAYAYLPGFWRTQGVKLTSTLQHQLGGATFGDMSVNVLPRGYDSSNNYFLASRYRTHWRTTLDYAIPIYLGDLSVPALGYIRQFLLTPHADFLGLGKDFLWSAGADLVADMGQLLFFSTDIKLGVSFSWLGGNIYNQTEQRKPYSVSMILSFDL